MEKPELLSLTFSSETDLARIENLLGREYLVVPVVAMKGDNVVWPINAPHPQLVPASELQMTVDSWSNRPLVPNHPFKDGIAVSANTIDILENEAFGMIFNPVVAEGDLRMEAWIDVERAKELGGLPLDVLERVNNKNIIEISVGNYAQAEPAVGVAGGKPYFSIWRNIVPDHLALLPVGSTGACSVDMGCGALRANTEGGDGMSKWDKLIAAASKLIDKLDDEPEVSPEVVTEVVAAECSCGNNPSAEVDESIIDQPAEQKGGPTMSKQKTLAGRLIGLLKSPFTSECEETLLSFSEEQLEAMIVTYADDVEPETVAAEPVVEPVPATPAVSEGQVVMTKEVYADMLAASSSFKTQQAAEKTKLVAAIVAKSTIFTAAELNSKPNSELFKLASLVGVEPTVVPDLGVRDVVTEDSSVPAPPSLAVAIAARRQAK